MEIELQEIRDFLARIPPFDRLPRILVENLTEQILIRYIKRGSPLPPDNVNDDRLYLIRKGAILLHSKKTGTLVGKLGDNDICTSFCADDDEKFDLTVEEDTLVYTLSCETLKQVAKNHHSVLAFIQKTASQRLNAAVIQMQDEAQLSSPLMHMSCKDLMQTPVTSVSSGSSIYQAAKQMKEAGISSLIVTNSTKPVGIVTDGDITGRCVAARMSVASSIDEIMSKKILSVNSASSAYDALMIMTRQHIHHLPVIDSNVLSGIITVTDLIRQEGRNSAYLTSAIRKAKSVESLSEYSKTIPRLQLQLVRTGATSEHVGKGVTSITSAITRRLIQLAEIKLGPAPVNYAWVAAGSQARREQTSHTDQDNGLILSDDVKEADLPWFKSLAQFVCDGLNECGYIYCPGDVMAINPKWRQTENIWGKYFDQWINTPEPKALMYSSIFFDLRTIYGDKTLLKNIRKNMLQQTQNRSLFLAHLTANALQSKPPLGFFRDFVLVDNGEHADTLDLKHNGIAPIVDLARIYALAEGIEAVNTMQRLEQTAGSKSLSKQGSANLCDALLFISTLRIQHQAEQIKLGKPVDNFMRPNEISKLEREHLKDAFKVIQTMQNSLENKYRLPW